MPPPWPFDPAASLGHVVVDRAAGDSDHGGDEEAIAGGVVVRQVIEDAGTCPETGEDNSRAAGLVPRTTAGQILVQHAAADAGRPSHVVRNASAGPGPDKA